MWALDEMTYLKRSKIAIRMSWWHAHRLILWGRWCRSVWCSSRARIVLGSAPGKANTRVTNGIALHLIDSHLGGMALDELDKSTSFSWRNLDVSDFSKALEKRSELVLSNISRQTAHENGSIVWIRELVHWLGSTVVTHWGSTHRVHARSHTTRHTTTLHSWHATWRSTSAGLVLRSCCRDSHGTVATVNALHLGESTLLIPFLSKAYEAISSRHARDGICHDFCRFARWESSLEQ